MQVASYGVPTCLSDLTTLRLGGPAARMVTASTADELVDKIASADAAGEAVLVVGGGSNLVVADAGWPGLVVLVRSDGIERDGDEVTVQAGVVWDDLVARTVAEGWSGLAPMSGIPGLTGATPVQNVGAYGTEVADTITRLRIYDRSERRVADWEPTRFEFGFRTSALKHTDRYVVLAVTFALPASDLGPPVRYLEVAKRLGVEPGTRVPSADVRGVVLDLRRSKGMLLDESDHDTWSAGSFFVNPFVAPEAVPDGCPHFVVDGQMKLSAGWLIENAGFGKGYGTGRVRVSSKHSLALTNRGGATTEELLDLAREIRTGVEARFGIRLRPEAHLTGVTL
ncbi:MAG: UDP-N-acetylmuramate dehydrogenase [Jatrophihabitantaceae bacterium]